MFNLYEPPEPQRGQWVTRCAYCEWYSDFPVPYQDECEETECPECGSDDVIDVNLERED